MFGIWSSSTWEESYFRHCPRCEDRLCLAAYKNLITRQVDVTTAFLYGTIEEECFISQPEGFSDGTQRVCKLKKSIYGLKQSPRCWNTRIVSFSNKQYFFSIGSDQCILANPQFTCFIAIYVDDILFLAPEDAVIQSVVNNLEKEFKIKDLGHVNNLLGMKIIQKKGKITISQVNYVIKLLEEFNMLDCKPKSTPMDNSTQFSCLQSPNSEQEKSKMATKPYRSLIGKLHYLASHSRPDITFAVSLLSRYNNNPSPCHWKGA